MGSWLEDEILKIELIAYGDYVTVKKNSHITGLFT